LSRKRPERIAKKLGLGQIRAHILVCKGGSCAGKGEQKRALKEARHQVKALGLRRGGGRVLCTAVGCLGVCKDGPIAAVWPDGVFYRAADAAHMRRIVREHVAEGRVVEELCIARPERSPRPEAGSDAGSEDAA